MPVVVDSMAAFRWSFPRGCERSGSGGAILQLFPIRNSSHADFEYPEYLG